MTLMQRLLDLFVEKVPCSSCKKPAVFTKMWGRQSHYECKCGTVTKIKTYD